MAITTTYGTSHQSGPIVNVDDALPVINNQPVPIGSALPKAYQPGYLYFRPVGQHGPSQLYIAVEKIVTDDVLNTVVKTVVLMEAAAAYIPPPV